MLACSSNASWDARSTVAGMLALYPNQSRVGLLAVEAAVVEDGGFAKGERLMEFRQTQGMMDAQ